MDNSGGGGIYAPAIPLGRVPSPPPGANNIVPFRPTPPNIPNTPIPSGPVSPRPFTPSIPNTPFNPVNSPILPGSPGSPSNPAPFTPYVPSNFSDTFNQLVDNNFNREPPAAPVQGQVPGKLYVLGWDSTVDVYRPSDGTLYDHSGPIHYGTYVVGPFTGPMVVTENNQKGILIISNGNRGFSPNPFSQAGFPPNCVNIVLTNITVTPVDGVPDPSPPPVITNNPSPNPLAGLNPGGDNNPLPGLAPNPILLPGATPSPGYGPNPEIQPGTDPLTGTNPGADPLTGVNPLTGDPFPTEFNAPGVNPIGGTPGGSPFSPIPGTMTGGLDPITGNPLNPSPTPNPNPDPSEQTTPSHDCDAPTDPCQKKILDEIKKGKQKQDPTSLSGKIETERCEDLKDGNGDKKEFSYSGKDINGIESLVLALSKQVEELRKDMCYIKPDISLPDSWQIRKMTNELPQLVLSLKEWDIAGKKWKPSTWSITIPWVKTPVNKLSIKNAFKSFKLTRGSRMGILTLKDNSKVVVNARTEPEVCRVIDILIKHIQADKLPLNKNPRIVKRSDKLKEVTVQVSQIEFYSKGQMDDDGKKITRDWVIHLRPN
jgi:hypothetical protein